MPQLLQKTLEKEWRAVVLCGSKERVAFLNQHLWTYNPASFLPHGSAEDGFPEDQPIWLTARDENPNGAKVLMLLDGMTSAAVKDYDVCCVIFDGNDPSAVEVAQDAWRGYEQHGYILSYWQQTTKGWSKKEAHSA